MKALLTLILTGLLISVLATTLLGSSYNERSDSDDDRYETKYDSDDDRHEYGERYREDDRYQKRDYAEKDDDRYRNKNEFYGTIKRIPQGGLGTWLIDNKEIFVDRSTRIENEYGQPRVGSQVEVKGIYQNGTFQAQKIEIKN